MNDQKFLIENNTTLLAPGSLHLPLYAEIYKQKGNCLNITVKTLEAFVQSETGGPRMQPVQILYEYAKALEDLDSSNIFYASRRDYDFLKACYEFLSMAALMGIDDFPKTNEREEHIYQVLEKLQAIPLWQSNAGKLDGKDFSNVRILNTEQTFMQKLWSKKLMAGGAQKLTRQSHKRTYYWSCSNPRKEMEAAADAIIANDLKAENCLIALSDPTQEQVLIQILESRKIPWTLLHPESSSKVIAMFEAAIAWILNPNLNSLKKALRTLYPVSSQEIVRWLDLFEGQSDLKDLPWQDNSLIDEQTYGSLQSLEAQIQPWLPILEEMKGWDENSMEAIDAVIQRQIPMPDEEDLSAYDGVMSLYSQIRPYVHCVKDLDLFYRHLSHMHPSRSLPRIQGVLIGNRTDISPLAENVFYIGADASAFPGSVQFAGIFDEEYMSHLPMDDLDVRMNEHLESLKSILNEPESLFVLTPQSDYQGKEIESSHEMNMWLGMLPKFQKVPETSNALKPGFMLKKEEARALYMQEGMLKTRISSLDAYEDCPLKNLLRYGLGLKPAPMSTQNFHPDKRFSSRIMDAGLRTYGKPFYDLSQSEVLELVRQDFSFAARVFPHQKEALEVLAQESTLSLMPLFAKLSVASRDWNMSLRSQEYQMDVKTTIQEIETEISGSISSPSKSSFCLYAQVPGDSMGLCEESPSATLDFSLQPKPANRSAFSISYGRGAAPARAAANDQEASRRQAVEDFYTSNISAHNLKGQDALSEKVMKKVPTYEQKEQSEISKAQEFVSGLKESSFQPGHKSSACTRCSFQSVCRNAAFERE